MEGVLSALVAYVHIARYVMGQSSPPWLGGDKGEEEEEEEE